MVVTTRVSTSSTSEDVAAGVTQCKTCSAGFGSQDYTVKCDFCSSVLHYRCGGYNDSTYASFIKLESAGLASYLCPPCKLEIARLSEKVASLESQLSEVHVSEIPVSTETRLSNVEVKLDSIARSLEALIPPQPPDDQPAPLVPPQPKSYAAAASKGVVSQAKVVVADLQKAKEEDSQRRSLVVAGLPENGQDNKDVGELVKLLDPSAAVCETFRMGRISTPTEGSTSRPRLLKVHLLSSSVVKSVLSQAKKLKDSAVFKGVFIRRSMTLKERQELGKLRTQCADLNQQENEDGVKYAIVNEKLARFTGCQQDSSGRLNGGTRDRSWSPPPYSDDLN